MPPFDQDPLRRSARDGRPSPDSLSKFKLPRRAEAQPSPADWRDEVLYFLLPDRFSDGKETPARLLDRSRLSSARPAGFGYDRWAESGGDRWQGGTLAGVISKLDYLAGLGVTALWLAPVFKQRYAVNSYHGYGIQDFLEVDPHFGSRAELIDLVDKAHVRKMRVILDIVFNHSGSNWLYEGDQATPPYRAFPGFYRRGPWLAADGSRLASANPASRDDGVWPSELQPEPYYTRAGRGSLAGEQIEDPHAEIRRTDFEDLRDFNFDGTDALSDLARCYKYWIALTDCDGLRIDTLKHVPLEQARDFCGNIREFAANIGKKNFFLLGEVAGPDTNALRYLEVLGHNLSATLDIGALRPTLQAVAKGLAPPRSYFSLLRAWDDRLGSHRQSALLHVSILDDHDHVFGDKTRFSADAASDHQVVAGVALQLFTPGIPCIYYGTEQALAGPEKSERDQYLPDWGRTDKYLREAMFGPVNPHRPGRAGVVELDTGLPGFGPFGTVGRHVFDPGSAAYVRIAKLTELRARYPVLRYGRMYQRPISNFGAPFGLPGQGELIAWSRILDDEEALCVVNGHGTDRRGGDVVVDGRLNGNPSTLEVVASTAEAAGLPGAHPVGEQLPVRRRPDGTAFVEIRNLGPSEVLVLVNQP
jgi:glycosidase